MSAFFLRVLLVPILVVSACLTWTGCASTPHAGMPFLYVALGASETAGVGAYPLTNGYAYEIKAELDTHFTRTIFLNLGVPGSRIPLIHDQVKAGSHLNIKPHLVTLFAGANDLVAGDDPRDFQTNLHRILTALRKGPWTVIVIANLPDMTQLPRFRDDPSSQVTLTRVKAFNEVIAKEATNAQAPIVDLFAEKMNDMFVSDLDGFHPNNKGHEELARLFLKVVLPSVGVD